MPRFFRINPLEDPRWPEFLEGHDSSSVFHTPAWLSALYHTYGYKPIVFTSSSPDADLTSGVPFCFVNSWVTGRRLVSLPFSDHCEPLVGSEEELLALLAFLKAERERESWKYFELRPERRSFPSACCSDYSTRAFYIHRLQLQEEPDRLFRSFHKSCVQRKIRRASREGLVYEEGRSERVLRKFYSLMVLTRRRHCLPPQPIRWFRNLIRSFGEQLKIRVVSKDDQPVAAILTLSSKKQMVYKYGCSDDNANKLGGMPFLLWRTIQDAKSFDMVELDLGRSDPNQTGLVTFKDRWNAERCNLTYYRYPCDSPKSVISEQIRPVLARVPLRFLAAMGRLSYKHFG